MSSRETILDTVRRNQPAASPLPEVPLFDGALPPAWPRFRDALARMGGRPVEPTAGTDLAALIADIHPDAKVVCSATAEVAGNRRPTAAAAPRDLDDVDVGIVRAVFGVAETGSVALRESEFGVPALGYLAQHLVVLLDPADVVGNLHHAYRRPEFAAAGYLVLMTGPSATADIEGVLIHGAQGVRSLTVVAAPRPRP
ncbi:MAG: lactate utilization protein C [Rhodospirillales bacterium]